MKSNKEMRKERKERKNEVLRLTEQYNSMASSARAHKKLTVGRYRRYNTWQRLVLVMQQIATVVVVYLLYGIFSRATNVAVYADEAEQFRNSCLNVVMAGLCGAIVWGMIWALNTGLFNSGNYLPLRDKKAISLLRDKIDEVNEIFARVEGERQRLAPLLEKFQILQDTLNNDVRRARCWLCEDLDKGFYYSAFLPVVKWCGYKEFKVTEKGYEELLAVTEELAERQKKVS